MKQVETIKSIVLFLLIALSLLLHFRYGHIHQTSKHLIKNQLLIFQLSNRDTIDEVIKPYKSVFRFQDSLTGTTDSAEIEHILKAMKTWTISGGVLKDQNFDADKLNLLMNKRDSFTLFYHSEVPLRVFEDIVDIDDINVPETHLIDIIVEWNSLNTTMDMHFISSSYNSRYSAKVHVLDLQKFQPNTFA